MLNSDRGDVKLKKNEINFLHVIGPDTKNSYGIMTQIYKRFDMTKHKFFITSYEDCKDRFPKLNEFENLEFVPKKNVNKIQRVLGFYKKLQEADVIIWHSLFFTTKKYILFLYFFRKFLKKSVWIEWGADLYLWRVEKRGLKSKIINHMNKCIRKAFPYVGIIFPTDEPVYKSQFGDKAKCFYTPMPNPMPKPTELMDFIDAQKPEKIWDNQNVRVQVAHNSFQFNNHIRILDNLEKFKDEKIKLILPLSYGKYGINGQFGGVAYVDAVERYAREHFKNKAVFLKKNLPFDKYVKFLWDIDIIIFDVNRPCGLGNLRILLYMGKKVYLPADNPYYKFFKEKGIQIFDTAKIPEMTFEEFIEPVKNQNLDWIKEYMNNEKCLDYWEDMFNYLSSEITI